MAGIKISDLPASPSAQLTDVFPIDQGAVTYKEDLSQVLSLFQTEATGTWNIDISGNAATSTLTTTATNATNTAITDDTTTNATMYPTWVTAATGNLPQKVSSAKLTFNPSTGTLTTTTFVGALTGNATSATTATTATNANNLLVTQVATNATFYPLFVGSSVTGNQAVDLGAGLTFNPSTNTLATTTFSGALSGNATSATTATTATNATNTAITDDTTTNATMYLTWVTANTGNLPQKVSSSKLSFNPSTGELTATSFNGATNSSGLTALNYLLMGA